MGGIGKTNLAQIIYNDKRVQDNFHIRVWECVSDQFDLVGITKAILESVSEHHLVTLMPFNRYKIVCRKS